MAYTPNLDASSPNPPPEPDDQMSPPRQLGGRRHLILLTVAIGSLLIAIMALKIPTAVALIVSGSLAMTLCLAWGVPWARL